MTTAVMTNEALFAKAHEAGMAAAQAKVPEPMTVIQHANPFDDSSPIVKRYAPIASGVCGFAWVNIRPGTCSFARYLRQRGLGHKGYYGGWEYWVSDFDQSYERKMAYAQGFAQVLKEAGIEAYASGRLD